MKKRLVRIGAGIGILVLCIIAAVICFHFNEEERLDKKIAELKAQGIPTSFAELEEKYKLPEGVPNAADIYLKAFAAYKPLVDKEKQNLLPVMGKGTEPNANEPYPAQRIAAAKEFVEQNQEMFALLHEAGKVKDCCYPIDSLQKLFPPNDLLVQFRKVCQSLRISIIYYSQVNQPEKAYNAIIEQLRLGQSLCSNPNMINHLVRDVILAMGISGIKRAINQTNLDAIQLQRLQEYLQQIEQTRSIEKALNGEICFCIEYKNLDRIWVGSVDSASVKMAQIAIRLIPENTTKQLESYQQILEVDNLPLQEQLPKVCNIVEKANELSSFCFSPKMVLPAVKRVFEIHLRMRADMACAIMALAVERYRLKEGRLPETLEELVPGYLEKVYIDPFDGKPLRYKKTEPGYMIYTIGEDGIDNGGQERPADGQDENYDWAFRVYQ